LRRPPSFVPIAWTLPKPKLIKPRVPVD